MTPEALTAKLKSMYREAPYRERVVMIHLFGILYAQELERCDVTTQVIAENATGSYNYGAELSKMIKLSKYVEGKKDVQEKFT